ncbi:MAG: RNA polymerase factor sigma-54 [bacterium]|nr:RNA polymerase factor sigma-54 [bacterium]
MAVSLQLGVKQTQKLVMTQTLRQAIEMLQLSTVEISERIAEEFLQNPVLEQESLSSLPTYAETNSIISGINRNLSGDDSVENRREEQRNSYDDTSDSGYSQVIGDYDNKIKYIENVMAHHETLIEHLLWQARLTAADESEYGIYEAIITSLDDTGVFAVTPADFAVENDWSEDQVLAILESIKLFDPVGCGTTGVKETLVVQARHFYPDNELLDKILTRYFLELEKLEYDKISKELNISVNDVIKTSKFIHNLDPFPGRQYSTKQIKYIVPDIEVELFEDEIIINIKDEWIPEIRINSYYIDLLKKKNIEKKQKEYIQDKLQSAKLFIKNISSRRDTIIKVVTAIMDHQKDFLRKGPGHLTSLTHLDIADLTGVHESTVSRVTSNKFVQTGWGVFELKYFFVSRIKSNTSYVANEKSSDEIKGLIQELVEKEDPENPLSDNEIVVILSKSQIPVARRTVAKYRGILNIPSSNKRKKLNMIKSEERL